MPSWKAEFQVVSDPKWYDNSIRLPNKEMCDVYALEKSLAWTAVRDFRVVESTDPANYTLLTDGTLHRLPATELEIKEPST